MINMPVLSWRPLTHPDVVSVGQQITAEVLDGDMVSERVPLSSCGGGRYDGAGAIADAPGVDSPSSPPMNSYQ